MEIDSLSKSINHLDLIKKLYETNNVTATLDDVFGVQIPASSLRGDISESFEGMNSNLDKQTIDRKIIYEYNSNNTKSNINRILYIIYYIILLYIGVFLFRHEFKNLDRNRKIAICIGFLIYPYLKKVFIGIYNIFIIIIRFVS